MDYTTVLIIGLTITTIVTLLAYRGARKELKIVKDVDYTDIVNERVKAQNQYVEYEIIIHELKKELHNMEVNRNYYKKKRNKLQDILMSYEGKEKTLNKFDKLIKHESLKQKQKESNTES